MNVFVFAATEMHRSVKMFQKKRMKQSYLQEILNGVRGVSYWRKEDTSGEFCSVEVVCWNPH